jgi:hypothetical protein
VTGFICGELVFEGGRFVEVLLLHDDEIVFEVEESIGDGSNEDSKFEVNPIKLLSELLLPSNVEDAGINVSKSDIERCTVFPDKASDCCLLVFIIIVVEVLGSVDDEDEA